MYLFNRKSETSGGNGSEKEKKEGELKKGRPIESHR